MCYHPLFILLSQYNDIWVILEWVGVYLIEILELTNSSKENGLENYNSTSFYVFRRY